METIKEFFEQKLFTESGKDDSNVSKKTDPDKTSSTFSVDVSEVRVESEIVKQWRKQHEKLLSEKDKNEAKKKEEWLKSAKAELETWHKRNMEVLKKIKENNRVSAESAGEVTEGNEDQRWEKICRYCDFSPSYVEGLGNKDRSRMLSVLLRLKESSSL